MGSLSRNCTRIGPPKVSGSQSIWFFGYRTQNTCGRLTLVFGHRRGVYGLFATYSRHCPSINQPIDESATYVVCSVSCCWGVSSQKLPPTHPLFWPVLRICGPNRFPLAKICLVSQQQRLSVNGSLFPKSFGLHIISLWGFQLHNAFWEEAANGAHSLGHHCMFVVPTVSAIRLRWGAALVGVAASKLHDTHIALPSNCCRDAPDRKR